MTLDISASFYGVEADFILLNFDKGYEESIDSCIRLLKEAGSYSM